LLTNLGGGGDNKSFSLYVPFDKLAGVNANTLTEDYGAAIGSPPNRTILLHIWNFTGTGVAA